MSDGKTLPPGATGVASIVCSACGCGAVHLEFEKASGKCVGSISLSARVARELADHLMECADGADMGGARRQRLS